MMHDGSATLQPAVAHQEKALRLITVAYEGAPEVEGMPDARQAMDDILSGNDYVFPTNSAALS